MGDVKTRRNKLNIKLVRNFPIKKETAYRMTDVEKDCFTIYQMKSLVDQLNNSEAKSRMQEAWKISNLIIAKSAF